jgi:hypothetical protein
MTNITWVEELSNEVVKSVAKGAEVVEVLVGFPDREEVFSFSTLVAKVTVADAEWIKRSVARLPEELEFEYGSEAGKIKWVSLYNWS